MSRTHNHPPGVATCFWCAPTISGRIMFGRSDDRIDRPRESLYVPPDEGEEIFRRKGSRRA